MSNEDRLTFISRISYYAHKYRRQYGIAIVSPIIAQACLESGFGTSKLAKHNNFFGMKCGSKWPGRAVSMRTGEEYTPGIMTTITADFRAYDTMEDGVKGYFDFINTGRYHNLRGEDSPRRYCEKIKADGWATDSQYVGKLLRIINTYDLTRYDSINSATDEPKDNQKAAWDVIHGKYGNGDDRKRRLANDGYDYAAVQKIVNQLIREGRAW